MAYPSGVSLAIINAGNAFTAFGDDVAVEISVTPKFPKAGGGLLTRIVHAPTGWVMTSDTDTFHGEPGTEISFSVPHVDQPGFRDPAQNEYTGWYYEVKVTVGGSRGRGRGTTYTQTVQPYVGQALIDLDLIPDGPVGEAVYAPTATVTSVNGQTGAILIDDLQGEQGPPGPQGEQGLPGVNAVENDTAVAAYVDSTTSATGTTIRNRTLAYGAALGTTNLNTVLESGVRSQTISGNATTANNYPPGEYRGTLVTYKDPSQGIFTNQQYLGGFTKKLWQREYYGGAWSTWTLIGPTAPATAAFADGSGLGTTHLDTVVTAGFRQQTVTSNVTEANGYPAGAGRGVLITYDWTNDASRFQTYLSPIAGKAWMREQASGGAWGAWTLLGGGTGGTPAPAVTQVQEQRTVSVTGDYRPDAWAQPDGTVSYWTGPSGVERINWGYRGGGYVGKMALHTDYSTMQVRKVQSTGEVEVSCLDPGTGTHVTHRVQGVYTVGQDEQRRIEETWVGTYTGTTVSKDLLIMPRSNIEWAFQIDVAGNKQFAPYHGSASSMAYQYEPATITDGNGDPLNIDGMAVDAVLTGVQGFKVRQRLYLTHPDSGTQRWAAVDEVHTITPEGMLQTEAVITFLQATTIASNYGPMTPVDQSTFGNMKIEGGNTYSVLTTPPATTEYLTIAEGHGASSAYFWSNTDTDAFVAVNYLDRAGTFMTGHPMEETGTMALRLEQRSTSGLTKLYPQVFASGSVIPAGTVWRPAAQWRYGQAANAAQYA